MNFHKIAILTLSGIWLFPMSSCSMGKKDTNLITPDNTQKGYSRKTTDVGKIATVNREEKFVLIKLQNAQAGTKHALLYIESEGRKATLTPTGEKIGSFLAADITKGDAMTGDRVFAITFKEEEKPEPLTPLSQPAPPPITENSQLDPKQEE